MHLAARLQVFRGMDRQTPSEHITLDMTPVERPLDSAAVVDPLLAMRLQMTRATMCHHYAQMEYDRTVCLLRRGELEDEMELYHRDYAEARQQILSEDPDLLQKLEMDLQMQKQLVFGDMQI